MVACTLCYIEQNHCYLMLHRIKKQQDINAGKWIGVGGHVEPQETPEECVRREVKEETGLTMGECTLRGVVDFINDQCESEIMYLYTSKEVSGELQECDEGVLKWVPLEEVPSLPTWEGDAIFLKDLREEKEFFHLQLIYHGDELISHRYLPRIILASGSPRRKELMEQMGLLPEVVPSTLPEEITTTEPRELVQQLSLQKAEDIASRYDGNTIVIGADTVVAMDGKILGKPKSHEDAAQMIRMLQGGTHQVYTGVTAILCAKERKRLTFVEETSVHVYPMNEEEIQAYAKSEEPMDKAGAYGIQGTFASYIRGIEGDYSNVVGLPVGPLWQKIKGWM